MYACVLAYMKAWLSVLRIQKNSKTDDKFLVYAVLIARSRVQAKDYAGT